MKTLVIALIALMTLSSFAYVKDSNNVQNHIQENTDGISHRIKLCQYKKVVPYKVVELMREIGGVTPLKTKKGSVYVTAPYDTEEAAAFALPKFKDLGFDEAQQVVEVADQLLSIEEYHEHYDDNGNQIDNGKPSVIRIWK